MRTLSELNNETCTLIYTTAIDEAHAKTFGKQLAINFLRREGFIGVKVTLEERKAINAHLWEGCQKGAALAGHCHVGEANATLKGTVTTWISRAHKDLKNTLLNKDGSVCATGTTSPKDKDAAPAPAGKEPANDAFFAAVALIQREAGAGLGPTEAKALDVLLAKLVEYEKAKAKPGKK